MSAIAKGLEHRATVVVRAASEQHSRRHAHADGPYMACGVWPHQMDCARVSARSGARRALKNGSVTEGVRFAGARQDGRDREHQDHRKRAAVQEVTPAVA